MAMCFLNTFYLGLTRDGALAGGLQSLMPQWSQDPAQASLRYVVDVSYFLVVTIVLTNLVLGVIIDTFAAQRSTEATIKSTLSNTCLICDIDRRTLDRHHPVGFQHHVTGEHDIFAYICFFIHLYQKDPALYSGPEHYMVSLLERDAVSFFPLHRSFVLEMAGYRSEGAEAQKQAAAQKGKAASQPGAADVEQLERFSGDAKQLLEAGMETAARLPDRCRPTCRQTGLPS